MPADAGVRYNRNIMGALPKRYFTPEEYLLLESRATYKSQYVAGEIFPMGEDTSTKVSAMGGAQPIHVLITDNLTVALRTRLRGWPCHSYSSDLRVAIEAGELYTYPDVSALCGQPRFDEIYQPASLLNPQVIFEVLSPSTEAFDRGDKFGRYRRLESFTQYVLISTERRCVEHFIRQADGSWKFVAYTRPNDSLPLEPLSVELPLAEIYERVQFPEAGIDK